MEGLRSGSEVILECLKKEGVKYLFGVAGSDFLSFLDLIQRTGDLKFIPSTHEESSAYMALGYSQITNGPAVCIGTMGPGIGNMFNAIWSADHAGAPVIVIAPKNPPWGFHKRDCKNLDQRAIFSHITKMSLDMDEMDQLVEGLEKAFRVATTGRFGPVLVGINRRLFDDKTIIKADSIQEQRNSDVPSVDHSLIEKAANLITRSERPVIMFGDRVFWSDAHIELINLVDTLAIPVVGEVWSRRAAIPEDNPSSMGILGFNMYPPAIKVVEEADLLITLNCDFDDFTTHRHSAIFTKFTEVEFLKNLSKKKIIQVDSDHEMMGQVISADIEIVGDCKAVLKALRDQIPPIPEDTKTERLKGFTRMKEEFNKLINEKYQRYKDRVPINPWVLVKELGDLISRDAIVVQGGAGIGMYTMIALPVYYPNSYITSGTSMSLGQAFPKALAAKLAKPEKQVVCITGDGDFWFSGASELETLRRLNLPVVTVIANNRAYGNMKHTQRTRYDARYIGVDLKNPNFAQLAEVFGILGERVEKPDQIKPALEKAFGSNRPAMVDVVLPSEEAIPQI